MGTMRGSIRASVLVLALMVTAEAVGAWPIHQWQWQCHGPYLGTRARLAVPPAPHDGVFAVQYGGGFFTGRAGTDDQTIWEPGSRNGLSSLNMTAVAAGYGALGVTILVGTGGGLYRSDDWGDNWIKVDDLGQNSILCLAAQPAHLWGPLISSTPPAPTDRSLSPQTAESPGLTGRAACR